MAPSVTLHDVAVAAGVSPATASRVLSGAAGRSVTPELREKVQAAAARLGYSPNAHAQAMARGGAGAGVGLVVHDIGDPFAAAVASGVMAAAAELGLLVTVAATMWDPQAELAALDALRRTRPRAVVLAGSRFTRPDLTRALTTALDALRAAGAGVATVGQRVGSFPAVVVDEAGGARRLATVLWTLGYRSYAVLAGPESLATSEQRLTGFRAGLAEAGHDLPAEHIIATQLTRDGGYVAMTQLLDSGIEVEAVFAVNDVMAVGAMAALREHRFQVPRDLALAGFDDILTLRDIQPPLTTVRLPLAALGRRALHLALDAPGPGAARPRGGNRPPTALSVGGEVVVRASTPVRG